MGWVDYKKAYDMTPHPWIREILRAIRAPKVVRRALKKVVPAWKTWLQIPVEGGTVRKEVSQPAQEVSEIKLVIKWQVQFVRGLYQGDSLSPLLFCLCVAPISHALSVGGGFKSRFQPKPVTHIFFMDDLKVYEECKQDLEATLSMVEGVSEAVGMKLGLKKCAVAHMRAGRVRKGGGADTGGVVIPEVGEGDAYKYLGIEQVFGARGKRVRDRVRKEYLRRTRITWASPLKTKAKVQTQTAWCAGAVRYFCSPITWTPGDLARIDTATRKILRRCMAHHKNAAVERVHLPRRQGGRGIPSILQVWENEVVAAALYLLGSEDEQVRGAMRMARELKAMCVDTLMAQATRLYQVRAGQKGKAGETSQLCSHNSDPNRLRKVGGGRDTRRPKGQDGGKGTGEAAERRAERDPTGQVYTRLSCQVRQ